MPALLPFLYDTCIRHGKPNKDICKRSDKKTCNTNLVHINSLRTCAGVAQLVEQWTENPRVGSSILSPGTTFKSSKDYKRPEILEQQGFLAFHFLWVFTRGHRNPCFFRVDLWV